MAGRYDGNPSEEDNVNPLSELKKREKELQAREEELDKREKELKRREEAAARAGIAIEGKNWSLPADVQNVFEKYHNMWLEEFISARSKFETSVTEIQMRNTSALKAELISALTAGTREVAAAGTSEVAAAGTSEVAAASTREVAAAGTREVTRALQVTDVRRKDHTTLMSPRKGVKARHAKNTCAVQNVAIIYDDRMLAHQPPEGKIMTKNQRG